MVTDGVSLRDWTKLLFKREREARKARFKAVREAIQIASSALTIRLDHSNGLIKQMADQAEKFAQKSETAAELRGLESRLDILERKDAAAEGRAKGGERLTQLVMLIVGYAIAYVVTKLGAK